VKMQFPEQITIGFLFSLFAYGAIVGTLQIVAARHRLVGLSLLGVKNPLCSYLLGSALLLLAYGWFFGTRGYEIFSPGPAGSEFAFFLGLAFLAALFTTLLIPNFTREPSASKLSLPRIYLEPGRGILYLPKGSTLASHGPRETPRAAICALAGLEEGTRSLEPLAAHLAEEGFMVLALELSTLEYPDLLALIPSGVAYLATHSDVDPKRIGVLGVDLGADLAIRSASGDEQVKAVVALSPVIEITKPGLHILAEMPYLQGMRWARAMKGLVNQIASLEHFPQSRPCLLLYGGEDRLAPQQLPPLQHPDDASTSEGEVRIIRGEKRFSLPRSPAVISLTADWFREHLGR